MGKSKSSDFKVEDVNPGAVMLLLDGIIETMTFGAVKAGAEVTVTNTKTGEAHGGWGEDRKTAEKDGRGKFEK